MAWGGRLIMLLLVWKKMGCFVVGVYALLRLPILGERWSLGPPFVAADLAINRDLLAGQLAWVAYEDLLVDRRKFFVKKRFDAFRSRKSKRVVALPFTV